MPQFQLTVATRANQSLVLPVVLIATSVNECQPDPVVSIIYEDTALLRQGDNAIVVLEGANGVPVSGTQNTIHGLCKAFPFLAGQGKSGDLETQWIPQIESFSVLDFKALDPHLQRLDTYLVLRSFVVGYSLSTTDIALWGAIRGNRVATAAVRKGSLVNLSRWFRFIEELCPWAVKAIEALNAASKEKKAAASRAGGNYDVALLNTEHGVVTRFPPEPSGYLHIGHAKAALLNDFFAHEKYSGTLILRFDDTNPSKEKMEFQDSIIEDLALMGIKPDKMTYTSDYFDELYQYAIQMIKDGNAYADDTDKETMGLQRRNGEASKCRGATVEENLAHFEEMRKGTPEGIKFCIRAKISVDDPNKAMRDPVCYRCNPTPHHRTGAKWKIYPTYDFACPIVDSKEGVTHALRTTEYRDRNPQYYWMLDALKLRKVQIWDFARMNFVRTLLSKRKLTKLVDMGVVWGWDDPRFPTIRGIRRRGMTIPGLREFIIKQGPSKNITNLDWSLIWATNKKYIDPVAPRHTAISKKDMVKTTVRGGPSEPRSEEKPKHAKNADVGMKKVIYSSAIVLEQEDAKAFKEGEEITLMNWGNAIVRDIVKDDVSGSIKSVGLDLHLDGDVKKTEKKITWLAETGQEMTPVELVDFDHLLSKDSMDEADELENILNPRTEFREDAVADCNVAELRVDDIIQFDRKGYYRVDRAFAPGQPAILFNIPTGKSK